MVDLVFLQPFTFYFFHFCENAAELAFADPRWLAAIHPSLSPQWLSKWSSGSGVKHNCALWRRLTQLLIFPLVSAFLYSSRLMVSSNKPPSSSSPLSGMILISLLRVPPLYLSPLFLSHGSLIISFPHIGRKLTQLTKHMLTHSRYKKPTITVSQTQRFRLSFFSQCEYPLNTIWKVICKQFMTCSHM